MNLCAAAASEAERFDNVARYHPLCDGVEQDFAPASISLRFDK